MTERNFNLTQVSDHLQQTKPQTQTHILQNDHTHVLYRANDRDRDTNERYAATRTTKEKLLHVTLQFKGKTFSYLIFGNKKKQN